MKILELRFKNLNSLYGEWIIDFTNPEYISNGIFALTGPTGAGKSTILDAICLALYGATPRLGKITKSGNEIMSRQTGECYAEVMFESQSGRFRCHWEQRRSRKKAEGNLQDQEHQIVDADTGKPIETKKSLVPGIIEKKTGMDFDRFTRSILLAQGGFDTFLKADAEQKSKILEQITGTEIYSEISCRVHIRQRDERDKLKLLQAETSGIAFLEPEQESELQEKLKLEQKKETELEDKFAKIRKDIICLTVIDELNNEIKSLDEEEVIIQGKLELFKPQVKKLDLAIKAASMDGVYAKITASRNELLEDQASLKAEEIALPKLESSAHTQSELTKQAEQQLLTSKEELLTALPLIKNIRSIDQKLAEQAKAILKEEENVSKDERKIKADKQTCENELKKRSQAEKKRRDIQLYRRENKQDEWLVSNLSGIQEQLNQSLIKQKEIQKKDSEVKSAGKTLVRATKALDHSTKQFNLLQLDFEGKKKQLQQAKDTLNELLAGRLLREYRTEKDMLFREITYLKRIEELEDHRANLEDGKPCPLCGATEHPFAEGNIPSLGERELRINALTELIGKADNQEADIKILEEAESVAHKKLSESENQEVTSAAEKKAAEKSLKELKNALAEFYADFNSLTAQVSIQLEPYGITEIPEGDLSSLLDSLKKRLEDWQLKLKEEVEIERQLADMDSEIKSLDAIIETQSNILDIKKDGLELLRKENATGIQERTSLYGNNKPDEEESVLNKVVAKAEQAEKKARLLNIELQKKLAAVKDAVKSLKKRVEQRLLELKKAEVAFLSELKLLEFLDEKSFLEAILSNQERNALSEQAKKLDNARVELKAKQKDREKRLCKEIEKIKTDKSLKDLMPQFEVYEASLKEIRAFIANLQLKLEENAKAKDRIKEKQATIEAQKKESRRWANLHELIGSADGKKYRNFAQGLTFELMVSHANRQLKKMTDRYLLIRDSEQALELNVIDNYQAGEIRSTKNLSGGESFIVSLTLALGLSKMASRKVRVDSLFLDEGFGTLDEEALETALETLSGLQQDGKLIGIISHVSALKERISTQINVTPISGGRGSLIGPGCKEITDKTSPLSLSS